MGQIGNYKYTGKEKDATGLYYFGARYYDPAIGRFITRDPVKGDHMNSQMFNFYKKTSHTLQNKLMSPQEEMITGILMTSKT